MPYYLNIICDHEDKNCRVDNDGNPSATLQPVGFNDVNETFQNVLDSVIGVGWTVEGDLPPDLKFFCPRHSKGT